MTCHKLYSFCCRPMNVLIVISFVTILSVLVLFPSSSVSALSSGNNILSKSYQNKTLGIDIHYPSNWEVITTECKPGQGPCYGPTFIRPIINTGNQSVQLEYMFPQVVMQNTSLQEQAAKIINTDNASDTDLTLIYSKQIPNINGNHAWIIEYIFNPLECGGDIPQASCKYHQESGSPYDHVMYTLIEKSGKLYEFKYSAQVRDDLAFYKNLNVVKDILGSFKPMT
jgi:hypothetical protein